jgi:hypothetical protein
MRIRTPEEKRGKEKDRYLLYEGETSERTEKKNRKQGQVKWKSIKRKERARR